jgi:hypothetical protein
MLVIPHITVAVEDTRGKSKSRWMVIGGREIDGREGDDAPWDDTVGFAMIALRMHGEAEGAIHPTVPSFRCGFTRALQITALGGFPTTTHRHMKMLGKFV